MNGYVEVRLGQLDHHRISVLVDRKHFEDFEERLRERPGYPDLFRRAGEVLMELTIIFYRRIYGLEGEEGRRRRLPNRALWVEAGRYVAEIVFGLEPEFYDDAPLL